MTATKRKRNVISFGQEQTDLDTIDEGESHKTKAAELGSDRHRDRTNLITCKPKSLVSCNRKTTNNTEHAKLNEPLFLWFTQQRNKEITISGLIIYHNKKRCYLVSFS